MLDVAQRTLQVGLIGSGIQLSRSPALHEAEGRANGLDLRYRLLDLDERGGPDALPSLLHQAAAEGFAGVNVTHPVKQAVIPHLDALSPEAEALGAVNTVVLREGRRIGHNTDCSGFRDAFRRRLGDATLAHVVQLGAGGAGAAVAHALLQLGTQRLSLFDRERDKAGELARRLTRSFAGRRIDVGDDLAGALSEADGLVHATPTGTAAHPGLPLDAGLIAPRHFVAEIVYFPLETELLPWRARAAAAPWMGVAWPCSRRPAPSNCSPGSGPTRSGCWPISKP
jgi:shikimate dehydrogenase